MTKHWNQNRSSFRTGEPEDHVRAKEFIGKLLKWSGYDVHYEYPLVDPIMQPNYTHNYDIVAFRNFMIVEIDDPALHSKPKKKLNDRIAQSNAREHFPISLKSFLRLDKDEINSKETFDEYLSNEFWMHVK